MKIKTLLASSLIFMLPLAASAETVQKWVDDKGQVHFSDKKPAAAHVNSTEVKIQKAQLPGGEEARQQQLRQQQKMSEKSTVIRVREASDADMAQGGES
jgi:hypothetical protein